MLKPLDHTSCCAALSPGLTSLHKQLMFWAALRERVSSITGFAYRGEKLWRAKPAFPKHTPEGVRLSGNVSTVPYLKEAALQMLKQGCGEGWLLQPKILDMPDLEYRWNF